MAQKSNNTALGIALQPSAGTFPSMSSADYMPVLDPKTHTVSYFKAPVRDLPPEAIDYILQACEGDQRDDRDPEYHPPRCPGLFPPGRHRGAHWTRRSGFVVLATFDPGGRSPSRRSSARGSGRRTRVRVHYLFD